MNDPQQKANAQCAKWLRRRAESFDRLASAGFEEDPGASLMQQLIRDELVACADQITSSRITSRRALQGVIFRNLPEPLTDPVDNRHVNAMLDEAEELGLLKEDA